MKRTDITSLFPEATDEQINALMKINGDDINSAKRGIEELQTSLKTAQEQIAGYEQNKTALQEAVERADGLQKELDGMKAAETIRITREEAARAVGVPAHLLTGDTKESCEEQARQILAFANNNSYPNVPDGGEPARTVKSTRDQFAEWFENLR